MQPCTYYYSFVRFSIDEEKFNKMALYIYSLLKGKEKKLIFIIIIIVATATTF